MRMQNKYSSFHPDIAGLRAWAVLAVVLFHFGVPGFAGGFVGVDVFFVISGNLDQPPFFGKFGVKQALHDTRH